MQDFVYIRFTKKQSMIAKKSEHTTYMGVLLFSAFPKSDCTPFGGGPSAILDNCSGVSSARVLAMIDICFGFYKTRLMSAKRPKWDSISYWGVDDSIA